MCSTINPEKEQARFEYYCTQARHIDGILHKIPLTALSVNGGIWVAAGYCLLNSTTIPTGLPLFLVLFSSLINTALFLCSLVITSVLSHYLNCIQDYTESKWVNPYPFSMMQLYQFILLVVAVTSYVLAFVYFWPSSWLSKHWAWSTIPIISLLSFSSYTWVTSKFKGK